ncbi:hypothetical protein HRbin21_00052 [bacterium HR21]|nr:hypothetical protein HRbin21_00052 [bacterium HR21]
MSVLRFYRRRWWSRFGKAAWAGSWVLAVSVAVGQTWRPPRTAEIFRAFEQELQRARSQLRLQGAPEPYYIEYRLRYQTALVVQAVLGEIVESSENPRLTLTVGVRVGTPEVDNTNTVSGGILLFGQGSSRESYRQRLLPVELNDTLLRRELWLATDAAYKDAVEQYGQKLNLLRTRQRTDTTPDFRLLPPALLADTLPVPRVGRAEVERLCRELSAVFRSYPELIASMVGFEYLPTQTWYANSEGRQAVKTELFTGVEVVAYAQAEDGTQLVQYYSAYAPTPAELPSVDSLRRAVAELAERLRAQRSAPRLEQPYIGPVLFEGRAAGELIAQLLVPQLIVEREPLSSLPGFLGRRQSLVHRLGSRLLPEFLSLRAVPCLRRFEQTPLVGAFCIDDEGMPAETVTLIEHGILRQLLTTRVPTQWFPSSTGHNRAGAPMAGVLECVPEQDEAVQERAQLLEFFRQLLRQRGLPYGIVVRSVANLNIMQTILQQATLGKYPPFVREGTLPLLAAYRVYPDGRSELLQPCDAVELSVRSLRDILALSRHRIAYNYLAVAAGRGSEVPYVPVSLIVPDILLEEVEIRPREGDVPRLPVVPPPFVQQDVPAGKGK